MPSLTLRSGRADRRRNRPAAGVAGTKSGGRGMGAKPSQGRGCPQGLRLSCIKGHLYKLSPFCFFSFFASAASTALSLSFSATSPASF